MGRKLIFRIIFVIVIAGAAYRYFTFQRSELQLTYVTGQTMGTIQYNVKYLSSDPENYKPQIDSVLKAFNQSLSTYIPDSEISTLNKTGELADPSSMFLDVIESSQYVFSSTEGTFDPTVGPLVNAWGFGPDKILKVPDSAVVDSLMQLVGFEAISFSNDLIGMNPEMYLDFSAIAKGYAVDLLADFLGSKDFENYMVEIGGEVIAKGVNQDGEVWKIGIEDPMVNRNEQKLLAIVKLNNLAMATSGNYRNYYEVGDRIIAHTIDPRTGYNTNHNLLSASVFAKDCMTADAFATAFMVVGVGEAKRIAVQNDLEIFLIYQEESGELRSYVSEGLTPLVEMNKLDK